MNKLNKIGIEELQYLIDCILEKKDNIDQLIRSFGIVASNNGYGTIFLTPKDAIFKGVWIHEKDTKVESVGLRGESWELRLSDLLSFYCNYNEGFERYDNEYFYVFFQDGNYSHTIKIYSKDRLLEQRKVLRDVIVDGVEIHLKW